MPNLSVTSLMKSLKSMQIFKLINSGLVKIAKGLKIQPKLLYVILALLACLFISLGYLSSQQTGKEGMNKICPTWKKKDEDGNCVN